MITARQLIDELAAGQPLSESEAESLFAAVFDGGVPDLEQALGRRVLDTHRFYLEKLRGYPKCSRPPAAVASWTRVWEPTGNRIESAGSVATTSP